MRGPAKPYRPELFADFGTVHIRRMFGGEGLFAGDIMIGIVDDGIIYLKTDEKTRVDFIAEGMTPLVFRMRRTGAEITMSYYAIPERLYDEPGEFAQWARRAFAIADKKKRRA